MLRKQEGRDFFALLLDHYIKFAFVTKPFILIQV